MKYIAIKELRRKLKVALEEKDGIQLTVEKLKNASKSLNKLINSQIVDNCKKGLGYNAVPPPHTGLFMPPKPDLSYIGLEEFTSEPAVETLNAKTSEEVTKVVKKDNGAPIIEDWILDSKDEDDSRSKIEKKIIKPNCAKIEFVKSKEQVKTPRKTTVKQVEKPRQNNHRSRENQRNWNNMMSQRLGSNFEMINKACYVCGSFDHLQYNCDYHQKQNYGHNIESWKDLPRRNVYGSSSEKVEGHGDWNAPDYTNTAGTYDGEINLAFDENMITNEYAVKLCLDYEVKKGNKVVKKELIVTLKGELYFVKFIINPKEDDVDPRVIFGRLFMRLVNGIVDFGSELDKEELLPFVCKMGKSRRNKKRAMENLNLFYLDIGTSLSTGRHLTQEEAANEALALRISQKFSLLEEVRLVLETMAYQDKYKKVLDKIWKDKVELDGMIIKEEEEAINKVKESDNNGEKEYKIKRNKFGASIYGPKPAAYLNYNDPAKRSLSLQAVINPVQKVSVWKKAVSFLGSLPVPLQHVNWKPNYKGCYTNVEEAKRQWHTEIREGCNRDAKSRYNTKLANLLPRHVYSPCDVNYDILNGMGYDGEINDMLRIKLLEAESNLFRALPRVYSELCHEFYSENQFIQSFTEPNFEGGLQDDHLWLVSKDNWRFRYDYIKKLIDSEGRLIPEDLKPGVLSIGIPRPPRASMQDLYERMGPELQQLTSRQISSGLIPNSAPSTSSNPPSKKDLDMLFQPMFDEYFKPSLRVVSLTTSATNLLQDTAGATSSIFIDQDAPSPSTTPNTETTITSIEDANVEKPNHENEDAKFDRDTFTNPFAPPVISSAESSLRIVDTSNMHTFYQPHFHTRK
uniref:Ribonuclease H-like domain-containing protein n=1 Tax=Tanacetum cinerariifolium TaxID=118510 RepID=A0A699GP94_TANCI|nr:ribonuclease H-like domain-containing protein [Tanacetum cinerariifolium]